MHRTVEVIASIGAAGVVATVPAAEAISAGGRATASASAKGRQAGTSYFGASADGGMTIVVSRDRRQVRTALFAYKTRCTDGATTYDYDVAGGIPIGANRRFTASYDSGPLTDPQSPDITVQTTRSLRGVINKRGSEIVGTARTAFVERRRPASRSCATRGESRSLRTTESLRSAHPSTIGREHE